MAVLSWKAVKIIGLIACCSQVVYITLKGGEGYLSESFSRLVGAEVEKGQLNHPTQKAAAAALANLLSKEDAAFDTACTTRENVLKKGFPLKWNKCTLQPYLPLQFFDDNDNDNTAAGAKLPPPEPLHVTVLGGSSSAHSGKNCSYESKILPVGDPMAGRYSNILMHELYEDFFHVEGEQTVEFDVINRAQGATDTVWSALMLDELLDTHADVLIVEYGINDALGGTTKAPQRTERHLAQMMNLWLWRVYTLFQNANKPPPPILFVYLWDANFYKPSGNGTFLVNADHLLHEGIGQTSWLAQKAVLEHYRQLGWSLGAINVGAVIDNAAVSKDPYVLLDDKHHPNCGSMHLISAMIRHAIYTDIIHCNHHANNNNPPHSAASTTSSSIRPMKTSKRDDPGGLQSELFQVLLDENTKVGSMMKWEPSIGSTSLALGGDSDFVGSSTAVIEPDYDTKSYPWRADHKRSFTLPRCTGEKPLHFTLLEPGLRWLGLGYKILQVPDEMATNDATTVIEMKINNVPILLSNQNEKPSSKNKDDESAVVSELNSNHTVLEFDEELIVKQWIKLADYLPKPPSPEQSLSFCYKTVYPTKIANLPRLDDCPYRHATSIKGVCELWDQENFDRSQTCPYAKLASVTEACFVWHDQELATAEEQLVQKSEAAQPILESKDFKRPQLNWVVGVSVD